MPATIPLTFVIPSFGRQQKLERAVASILSQVMQPEEIIVVDDASPQPLTLPDRFQRTGRVRIIRQPWNGGAALARNTGLAAARTDWVSFLDSDDWLVPHTLHLRWRFLQDAESRSPVRGRTVYGCGWQDVRPDGTVLRERIPRPASEIADFFRGCWFAPGSCIILNGREVLLMAGGADAALRRLEDYEWFIRIGLAGFNLLVQDITGATIERGDNTTFEAVSEAANLIHQRINDVTEAHADRERLRSTANAYLLYERAASAWREGRFGIFTILVASSMLARPRFRLSPQPGWQIRPAPTPALSP